MASFASGDIRVIKFRDDGFGHSLACPAKILLGVARTDGATLFQPDRFADAAFSFVELLPELRLR